jgi:AraC family transcriptional regulator
MDTLLKQILNNMRPVPPGSGEIFSNGRIAVVRAQKIFGYSAQFPCYEFVIPFCKLPKAKVDNKDYFYEANRVFPINPGQIHSAVEEKDVNYYFSIFIDKIFLEEMAHSIFGKSSLSFNNENFKTSNTLLFIINSFIDEHKNNQTGSKFILDSVTTQISVILLRELKSNLILNENIKDYDERNNIRKVIDFFREHLDCDYPLEEILKIVHFSPYHFIRIFKSEVGKTPYEFFMDMKIERAKELLKNKKYSVTEVGFRCGFRNPSHFSTVFKKKVGVSPMQYQKLVL